MRKIIHTRPDGGLSVVTPVVNTYPVREAITEAEAEKRAWDKLPADAINPQFVEASAIPADRTFRNAWKHEGGSVVHDMKKCRELHRDMLRKARAPKLAALDVEQLRGRDVSVQKQALRDLPQSASIDGAQTPEELKAIWPEILK